MWRALGIDPPAQTRNAARTASVESFTEECYGAIERTLLESGSGAVAIIGVDWDDDRLPEGSLGGHWFNAYVDRGRAVRWVDEQRGVVDSWPPRYQTGIYGVEAVVRSLTTWEAVRIGS